MTEKLFFSQEIITSWADDERVKFENGALSIATSKGVQEYMLSAAYRIIKVSDDSPDSHAIVGTILSAEEMAELGADVYLDSAIVGETPYDVEPGFVAVKAEDEKSIEDLLMEYLAKTLL